MHGLSTLPDGLFEDTSRSQREHPSHQRVKAHRLQDFTTRFYFRIDGTPANGGAKFFKVCGSTDGDGYANTTIRLV